MNSRLENALDNFLIDHDWKGRGPLSVGVVISQKAIALGLPLDHAVLLTDGEGQVKGLSGAAVNKILKAHGIDRRLAVEGGRTSRGNIRRMKLYVRFLNDWFGSGILAKEDLEALVAWWVMRIGDYLATEPFAIKQDVSQTLTSALEDLVNQAIKRQRTTPGVQYLGGLLHYLVGAKFRLISNLSVIPRSYTAADQPNSLQGDYTIGSMVLHVTTSPTEGLIHKCAANLRAGLLPVIVTLRESIAGAMRIADIQGIRSRIEFWDVIQLLSTNLYEQSIRIGQSKSIAVSTLITEYNKIVQEVELDQSFQIEVLGR